PGRRRPGGRAAPRRIPDAPHAGARRGGRHRAAEAPRDGLRQHQPHLPRAGPARGPREAGPDGPPRPTPLPRTGGPRTLRRTATFASAAWLSETGLNPFFKGKESQEAAGSGDQLYIQGHASPGIYARAFLDGRLNEAHLDNFRQESGGNGLPSYPHPRRLPW